MANEKRLIDANVLQRRICGAKCGCEYEDCGCEGDCVFDHFISNAPTVDAVEVVHGRWLPDMEEFDDDPAVGIRGGVFQTGWKCSICGRSERAKEPYCNCGAKMDGDENVV